MFDAIILSDLHLGSSLCQADLLLETLEDVNDETTHLLVLNGDVFDSHDFRRLCKKQWKVLSRIRKISGDIKVVWVAGNHDGPIDLVSQLLGVDAVSEFSFYSHKAKILATHGDRFDSIMRTRPKLADFGTWLYRQMSHMLPKNMVRAAKYQSKIYLRCVDQVKEGALKEANDRGFTGVVCGHTHAPENTYEKGILSGWYANSGSWTDMPCSYLTVKDGIPELVYVS